MFQSFQFVHHPLYATGPGSLPPGLVSKRRGFDDGASDVSSNQDYIGTLEFVVVVVVVGADSLVWLVQVLDCTSSQRLVPTVPSF